MEHLIPSNSLVRLSNLVALGAKFIFQVYHEEREIRQAFVHLIDAVRLFAAQYHRRLETMADKNSFDDNLGSNRLFLDELNAEIW